MNIKRKKSHGVIVAGLLLLVIGFACVISVLAINNWDYRVLSSAPLLTESNYVADKTHQTIFIEEDNSNIQIESTDDEFVSVKYFQSEKQYYTISDTETLIIKKSTDMEWYNKMGLFSYILEQPMVVSIPKLSNTDIDIVIVNGRVKIDNAALDNVKIKSNNGSVRIYNSTFNTLTTDIDNGTSNYFNITSYGDIITTSNNGKIEMDNIKTAKKIDVKANNGKIDLENIAAEVLLVNSDNGVIEIDRAVVATIIDISNSNGSVGIDNSKAKDIKVKTGNGVINFDDIDASNSIELVTDKGVIEGEIIGRKKDFNIVSVCGSGINNLPANQTGGFKQLTVRTSKGFIDIEFQLY